MKLIYVMLVPTDPNILQLSVFSVDTQCSETTSGDHAAAPTSVNHENIDKMSTLSIYLPSALSASLAPLLKYLLLLNISAGF